MRLLIINPGSTSTKISVFDDEKNIFTDSIFHDAPELLKFPNAVGQIPFRKKVLLSFLEEHDIPLKSIDVFVGRGGSAYTQPSGVIRIDDRLAEDTRVDVGGNDHPAKLGVLLAYELGKEYGKPMYTLNPTNVDELCDYARMTGIAGLYRVAQTHVLNQKATAEMHAKKLGKEYEDCNFIVCHIDGGITITAHERGKMIDSTEGAGGDGPYTPTRLGSIPIAQILEFLQTHTPEELKVMITRSGGFVSHFGTADSDAIHAMVEAGDAKANTVWYAMCYQISKSIGEMAAVLKGDVDGIILTGGLVRFDDLVGFIREHCGWIADISVYVGEIEQEAMAYAVLDVFNGKRQAREYTGKPVWDGFGWEQPAR